MIEVMISRNDNISSFFPGIVLLHNYFHALIAEQVDIAIFSGDYCDI